jgi:hypothetical protein
MNPLKPLFALTVSAGLVAVLSGCTSHAPDGPTASPTPSASATADTVDYGVCVDDQVTVLASQAKAGEAVDVAKCASVSIVGTAEKGVRFELGAVDRLVVEGDGLTVHAESAGEVIVPGNRNTVTHGGDSKVEDLGADNTVSAG